MKLFYILLLCVILSNFRSCNGGRRKKKKQIHKDFKKFNILLIYVDDLRPIGDDYMVFSPNHNKSRHYDFMPNIKKMAANGIEFRNAFAQQALCAPSRNSMLTGRRPDSLRLYDFYNYWRRSVANFTTFPQFFKERGYTTFSVGKIFHPGASSGHTDDYPYSWSHRPYHPPTLKYEDEPVCYDPAIDRKETNLLCAVDVKEQPGKTLPDLEILEEAVKILKRRNKKRRDPFLLAVGFHKPHIPFRFPSSYLARVPIDRVKPPQFPTRSERMPLAAFHPWMDVRRRSDINRISIPFPFGVMRQKWQIKVRQHYCAAANYVDDLIGQLMKHVNKKNTIVVLTSDHGWALGENNMWAKYSNFDVALKVPLIFMIPPIINLEKHLTIQDPVELIDVFPTLVELTETGKTIPNCIDVNDNRSLCFEGKSLVQFFRSNRCPPNEEDSFAFSQYPRPSEYPRVNSDKPLLNEIQIMGYTIRSIRFRYTEWISFNHTVFTRDWDMLHGTELYDFEIDSWQSYNLHGVAAYKLVEKELSDLLRSKVLLKENVEITERNVSY